MGNIEKEIKHFMWEYEDKIKKCENAIASCDEAITSLRRQDTCGDTLSILRKDRAVIEAQKQAYVQAKRDFESLLDCLVSI